MSPVIGQRGGGTKVTLSGTFPSNVKLYTENSGYRTVVTPYKSINICIQLRARPGGQRI